MMMTSHTSRYSYTMIILEMQSGLPIVKLNLHPERQIENRMVQFKQT